MSSTILKIPQITIDFGKIDKIIWYNVTDVDGTYSLNLNVTPNQSFDINVEVFNYVTKEIHFTKTYQKSSNSGIISETIKIRHTPGINSPIYGLKTF
jgi:hypothetical protein